jgi:uncharacterized protein
VKHRLLAAGPLVEVALAVKTAIETDPSSAILVFDDATGRVIDLDLSGSKADIVERLSRPRRAETQENPNDACEPRGRGRPRLGVVSREVTLLPRQWEWLAAQPNGASATLRRLVDEARRNSGPQRKRRAALEAAYRFMHGIAGDFAGYEEATRALFADDRSRLEQCVAGWPEDVRVHVLRLVFAGQEPFISS